MMVSNNFLHVVVVVMMMMIYGPLYSFAENIEIDWRIRSYDDITTAKIGDTITFNWSFRHNVYLHPSGSCDDAGATEVGSNTGVAYTFTEAGELSFVCQISGHCAAGQILKVIVVGSGSDQDSLSVDIDWAVPFSRPDTAPEQLQIGDTVNFQWIGLHNVYKMSEIDSCNFDDSVQIGLESPVSYVITSEDANAGEVTFACAIPGHCDSLNQILTFQAAAAAAPSEDADILIDNWRIQSYDDVLTATVGETIQFNWSGLHNVYIHPSGTCSDTGSMEVGTSTGASYMFTEDDAGKEISFVCQISGHCLAGQILKVQVVVSNDDPNTAVPTTTAPSAAPAAVGGFCFSGTTKVDVWGTSGLTSISDLRIGDRIKTNTNDNYDTVYSFGHYNPTQMGEFLQISITTDTNSVIGSSSMELSKDHLLLLPKGNFVPASMLVIGDQLVTTTTEKNVVVVVSNIKTVWRKGVYAPFTMSGTIAINEYGIIASSFVTLQEHQSTVTIGNNHNIPLLLSAHTMAYLFESIHRMWYRWGIMTEESYSPEGVSTWVEKPRTFFVTLLTPHYSALFQLLILIPCITILVSVNVMEKYTTTFVVAAVVLLLAFRRAKNKSIV